MRTICGASGCGKEFARPESAEKHHIEKHAPVKRHVGGVINGRFETEWQEDAKGIYFNGMDWGTFAKS